MDDDAAARAKAARESCPFLTAKQTAFHLGIARSTLQEKLRRLEPDPGDPAPAR